MNVRFLCSRGLTLIELVVTVAIISLLVVVSLPQVRQFQITQELSSAAEELKSRILAAQAQAIGLTSDNLCGSGFTRAYAALVLRGKDFAGTVAQGGTDPDFEKTWVNTTQIGYMSANLEDNPANNNTNPPGNVKIKCFKETQPKPDFLRSGVNIIGITPNLTGKNDFQTDPLTRRFYLGFKVGSPATIVSDGINPAGKCGIQYPSADPLVSKGWQAEDQSCANPTEGWNAESLNYIVITLQSATDSTKYKYVEINKISGQVTVSDEII